MKKTKLGVHIRRFIPSFIIRFIDPTSYLIKKFVSSISDELSHGSIILDAGAGEAPFKKFFTEHKYVAIDTKWGEGNWDYSKIDIMGDLTSLPVKSQVFDAVICTQVLEHLREPEAALREFIRVLKQGGSLYLSAPQGWGIHQGPHDYFRFTHYGIQYLLEKVGFAIVTIVPSCGYYGYLANRLTVFPKTLFWQIQRRWLRLVLLPLELVSYLFFVLLFPIILNSIDFLDKKNDYTLNYLVQAVKSHAETS